MIREAHPKIGLCEVSCELNDNVDKGLKNEILQEWAKKYNINYLDFNYNNCNYQNKNKAE